MIAHSTIASDQLIETLRRTIAALVRRRDIDLTARQLGVFLVCYCEGEPQTVRGLAQRLNIPRPVVSRILDRLEQDGFLRRQADPSDLRSVFTERTAAGHAFFQELRQIIALAATEAAQTSPRSKKPGTTQR